MSAKVWEEFWDVLRTGGTSVGLKLSENGAEGGVADFVPTAMGHIDDGLAPARAQLASAAPDLARMHLEVEWAATWVGDQPACCPSCSQAKPGSFGIRADQVGHKPDCEWLRVARKAGLLP